MVPAEPSPDEYDAVMLRVRMVDSSIISRRFHGFDTLQVKLFWCQLQYFDGYDIVHGRRYKEI